MVSSTDSLAAEVLPGNHIQGQCRTLRKKPQLHETFAVPVHARDHSVSPTHMVKRTVLYGLAQQNHLCLHETPLTAHRALEQTRRARRGDLCVAQVQGGRRETQ